MIVMTPILYLALACVVVLLSTGFSYRWLEWRKDRLYLVGSIDQDPHDNSRTIWFVTKRGIFPWSESVKRTFIRNTKRNRKENECHGYWVETGEDHTEYVDGKNSALWRAFKSYNAGLRGQRNREEGIEVVNGLLEDMISEAEGRPTASDKKQEADIKWRRRQKELYNKGFRIDPVTDLDSNGRSRQECELEVRMNAAEYAGKNRQTS